MNDDERILTKLHEHVQAELQTALELRRQNDLAEASLKSVQKVRQAESIRNRTWFEIAEKTANLVQQLPAIELLLHGFSEKLDEYAEQLAEVGRRLDRVDYALMLVLSGKGNKDRVNEFIKDIQKDRLKSLLGEHYALLHELEMKKVTYATEHSTLDIPAWLTREIADAKQEVAKLENDLRSLEE